MGLVENRMQEAQKNPDTMLNVLKNIFANAPKSDNPDAVSNIVAKAVAGKTTPVTVATPTPVDTSDLVHKIAQTQSLYTDTDQGKKIIEGIKNPPLPTIPGIFGLPGYQITGTPEKEVPANDDITISRALLSKMLQDSIALPPPTKATPVPGVK